MQKNQDCFTSFLKKKSSNIKKKALFVPFKDKLTLSGMVQQQFWMKSITLSRMVVQNRRKNTIIHGKIQEDQSPVKVDSFFPMGKLKPISREGR